MDRLRSITRTRTRIAVTLAITTLGASATQAPAQQPAAPSPPAQTITVIGKAQVKPTPRDSKSDGSIRKAVEDARRTATPRALADGQRRAASLSTLAGLRLGALVAIAETPSSPFGGFAGPFGEDGTFGPGRYCGITRQPVFRTDSQGRRRRVGSRQRRLCRVPPFVAVNLTMVFATS